MAAYGQFALKEYKIGTLILYLFKKSDKFPWPVEVSEFDSERDELTVKHLYTDKKNKTYV